MSTTTSLALAEADTLTPTPGVKTPGASSQVGRRVEWSGGRPALLPALLPVVFLQRVRCGMNHSWPCSVVSGSVIVMDLLRL